MKTNKWFILLLFFTGLGIVSFPYIGKKYNAYKQLNQVKEFQEEISKKEDEKIDKELEKVKTCYNKIFYNEEGVHDPFQEKNKKLNSFLECLGINENQLFASIEITKLKLNIPIYLGSTAEILSKGISFRGLLFTPRR